MDAEHFPCHFSIVSILIFFSNQLNSQWNDSRKDVIDTGCQMAVETKSDVSEGEHDEDLDEDTDEDSESESDECPFPQISVSSTGNSVYFIVNDEQELIQINPENISWDKIFRPEIFASKQQMSDAPISRIYKQ